MIKLNYQQHFEQMNLVIDNGQQTIERAILELKHLCEIWYQYEKLNQTFVNWLNQTENQLTLYLTTNNIDDQHTIEYLNQLSEIISDKDRQLKELEELELSIGDYDWSRQAHHTSVLRQRLKKMNFINSLLNISLSFRIIVLLGQCNSQLERAQQTVHFNQQWENLLNTVQTAFQTYQDRLMKIRQEQNSLIHLDTIQVKFEYF
jgi:hypothetical protein